MDFTHNESDPHKWKTFLTIIIDHYYDASLTKVEDLSLSHNQ